MPASFFLFGGEASDDEIREYFNDYGLSNDLCQKLITDKNGGRLITIHRIGSAAIKSDHDLILAMQDSIMDALRSHGIENKGEMSLRNAVIDWLETKEANRIYFDSLISEEKYMWDFGGRHVDEVLSVLKSANDEHTVTKMMQNIMRVAEDNGITALRMDIPAMCEWIKSILKNNEISAILFVWDEFTEYFQNNPNSLTGFQALLEISESHPFYFMIVTHESKAVIRDEQKRKKFMDRMVGHTSVRIELPDNMAFRLMAKAMKPTDDPVLRPEWEDFKSDLNNDRALSDVRETIIKTPKDKATMGNKTIVSDEELRSIVPLHPYAALVLKHMATAFNSNARSMFDFIISNDMTNAKAFKWYINNFGPLDEMNLMTVDMLWDFFNRTDYTGLNDDVRVILDSYTQIKQGSLLPDQERVFKTALLLEAISVRSGSVELLRPNAQNIDLAFSGTDWPKGKAMNIAQGLCEQGLLFERPVGNGMKEYTVANNGGDRGKIKQLKETIRNALKTQDLITGADLIGAVQLPDSIKGRFILCAAASGNFTNTANRENNALVPNRFKAVVTFAINDDEANAIKRGIAQKVSQPENELYYIESLVPLGEDNREQYIEFMAYSQNYASNDKIRAREYEERARRVLNNWKQNIANGAFMLYTPENASGMRLANLTALNETLEGINHQIYYCGLEQYNLTNTMFQASAMGQGAECGMTGELKGAFRSSSENTSLATALSGAWNVKDKYWEDPTKRSLPIVRIKLKVDELVQEGFAREAGRVSMLTILEALEQPPFGFMPINVTAFVMGFVLKDYATPDYFWSNGTNSDSMSRDKMKTMIANALKQISNPSAKYKEEYIVAMSASQRAFLNCTAAAFRVPIEQCISIENARDRIRIRMRELSFPIWCLKYLPQVSDNSDVVAAIDAYCGIANTANSFEATESDLAERIGSIVESNGDVVAQLERLFTNDMCQKGMLEYIDQYRDGELQKLAAEIGDSGAYLSEVKKKFSADAANWVWNTETADERISDVILEYRIIIESNKSLPKCLSMDEVVTGWNRRTNHIRIPYEILCNNVGDMKPLLEQLYYMKQSGDLSEQNRKKFYDALLTQRESFDAFYVDQITYFKATEGAFLDGVDESDIEECFKCISDGQFTKSASEYEKYIADAIDEYKKNCKTQQLKDLWYDKTGTNDPSMWSDIYQTPILCMLDGAERDNAKRAFGTIMAHSASDKEIADAIEYLEKADFYDRLNSKEERDRCFKERVVGTYDMLLSDMDNVRRELRNSIPTRTYDWQDSAAVKNKLKNMAERQYRLKGRDVAKSFIEGMNDSELRESINAIINGDSELAMKILKWIQDNKQGI